MGRGKQTGFLAGLPLGLLVWGVFSLAMWLPAIHALVRNRHAVSRAFFYTGLTGVIFVALIGLTLYGRKSRRGVPGQLLVVLATFAVLPLFLALPLAVAVPGSSYLDAYFEMVSSVTTTGASIYPEPWRIDASVHLWRAEVGWLGGLVMWIAASAILAPMSLGGFEVTARGQPGRAASVAGSMQMSKADPVQRLLRVALTLTPVYAGLTTIAWVLLRIAGEEPLTAIMHAMSVMATSGISPVGGMPGSTAGMTGEAIIFLFMFFALSRLTFSGDTGTTGFDRLDRDPEFRVGLVLVIGTTLLLFSRHWIASIDVATQENSGQALRALWGSVFTVMSFLTTTGFESADWEQARFWSGLGTPGIILMGLALVGGGVATTAGGVKLLRVYALYLNGLREMEKLVHPSSVGGGGAGSRRIRRDGAFLAWVFFMLFALSLALVTMALTAFGATFEQAILMAIATLSTTGPLIQVAAETPIELAAFGAGAKAVLIAAMVLGRAETLAIIALLAPGLWRD
jgi:trk system potassium uptake protein TrkH